MGIPEETHQCKQQTFQDSLSYFSNANSQTDSKLRQGGHHWLTGLIQPKIVW